MILRMPHVKLKTLASPGRIFLRIIAVLSVALCAVLFPVAVLSAYPPGFVLARDMMPDVGIEVRYGGENNFVGERIDSYNAPEAIMTVESAAALKFASRALQEEGYGIKIFDAYRPQSAVAHFVRWGKDLKDVRMKGVFYPEVEKNDLFKEGYIASKSGHSRGSTVDVTLTRLATGTEVDMGSPFDYFGRISHAASPLVSQEQAANRKILRDAMVSAGFKPLGTEWWHFSLANDPHPNEYFDFPVDHPSKADGATSALLDRASGGADRMITASGRGSAAVVRAYQRTEGVWTLRFETRGFFGRNGVTSDKREGDGATPAGVYKFGIAFGAADDPGSTLEYVRVSDRDVWVDDPDSTYYNEWADKNSPDADWKSAELLAKYTKAYKYAASIDYNTNPVVPGKGSAIFLHCSTGRPTEGCVSVPEPAMVFFLVFIDNGTKIAITTENGTQ
jgi:D-alanyl-D-alanine dipeptidase/L,D-peptidoglycan transpeptidase YkuD (ErfK/YbiS/YcfS/YnhG family)